jgi:sugar phosphate isomerase/epimerase
MNPALGGSMKPKLACADFTFPLLEHEQSLDVIRMLGFDGVDLALMGNRSHVRPETVREDVPGWARRLDERIHGRGLEVADFFLIPWTDFETMAPNHPDAAERERAADLFRTMLELAAAVDAAGFTLLPGIHWPDEPWRESLARSAEELAWRVDEGRVKGIRVSVEPHVGSVADTPEKALELAQACPGLEYTLDYTHFVFQGIPEDEVDPLARHARHVHFRGAADGHLQTTLRENAIDYPRILGVLRDAGYDGFIGIEYVWTPGDPPGGPYDLTHTDNISETILLRDLVRAELEGEA